MLLNQSFCLFTLTIDCTFFIQIAQTVERLHLQSLFINLHKNLYNISSKILFHNIIACIIYINRIVVLIYYKATKAKMSSSPAKFSTHNRCTTLMILLVLAP